MIKMRIPTRAHRLRQRAAAAPWRRAVRLACKYPAAMAEALREVDASAHAETVRIHTRKGSASAAA